MKLTIFLSDFFFVDQENRQKERKAYDHTAII
jgi:hypothetical protein